MNFKLTRNAVYKYPIFAHVDNVYANTVNQTSDRCETTLVGERLPFTELKGQLSTFLLYAVAPWCYAEVPCYNSGRRVSRHMSLFNEPLCGENQQSRKEFTCLLIACLETLALALTGNT